MKNKFTKLRNSTTQKKKKKKRKKVILIYRYFKILMVSNLKLELENQGIYDI
jgi:hypothetical protein